MRQLFYSFDNNYNYEWVTIINRTCLLDPLVIHNSPFIIDNSQLQLLIDLDFGSNRCCAVAYTY
jgi:hypothetical protein